MTAAIVVDTVDEIAAFRVPKAWEVLPTDWQQGLGYWMVIEALKMRKEPQLPMFGPPRDLVWTISRDPADFRAIEICHECSKCEKAKEDTARLVEADRAELVAFVQFKQDYLTPVGVDPSHHSEFKL